MHARWGLSPVFCVRAWSRRQSVIETKSGNTSMLQLVQASVEKTGPAADRLHQWFHAVAFGQTLEPGALRASVFLCQS